MLGTGRPSGVLGIVTAPPAPVLEVMVIAPLFTEYLNWASTELTSARSNSSPGFKQSLQVAR